MYQSMSGRCFYLVFPESSAHWNAMPTSYTFLFSNQIFIMEKHNLDAHGYVRFQKKWRSQTSLDCWTTSYEAIQASTLWAMTLPGRNRGPWVVASLNHDFYRGNSVLASRIDNTKEVNGIDLHWRDAPKSWMLVSCISSSKQCKWEIKKNRQLCVCVLSLPFIFTAEGSYLDCKILNILLVLWHSPLPLRL